MTGKFKDLWEYLNENIQNFDASKEYVEVLTRARLLNIYNCYVEYTFSDSDEIYKTYSVHQMGVQFYDRDAYSISFICAGSLILYTCSLRSLNLLGAKNKGDAATELLIDRDSKVVTNNCFKTEKDTLRAFKLLEENISYNNIKTTCKISEGLIHEPLDMRAYEIFGCGLHATYEVYVTESNIDACITWLKMGIVSHVCFSNTNCLDERLLDLYFKSDNLRNKSIMITDAKSDIYEIQKRLSGRQVAGVVIGRSSYEYQFMDENLTLLEDRCKDEEKIREVYNKGYEGSLLSYKIGEDYINNVDVNKIDADIREAVTSDFQGELNDYICFYDKEEDYDYYEY